MKRISLTKIGVFLLSLVPITKLVAPHRPEVEAILTSAGTILTGIGARNAIAKNGAGL